MSAKFPKKRAYAHTQVLYETGKPRVSHLNYLKCLKYIVPLLLIVYKRFLQFIYCI